MANQSVALSTRWTLRAGGQIRSTCWDYRSLYSQVEPQTLLVVMGGKDAVCLLKYARWCVTRRMTSRSLLLTTYSSVCCLSSCHSTFKSCVFTV